jgi:predicted ribosome quality control (RQC) complex YloA/Tae2 family protein
MLLNYYTLLKLKDELDVLIGEKISDVFSQEKDSLIIEFDSEEPIFLDFSSDNKYSCCFLRTDFKRAGKNTVTLFDDIIGEIVQDIKLFDYDRIIKIDLINSRIYLVLFGRGSSNFIITKKDDIIIDSLEDSKNLIGTKFEIKNNIIEINSEESVFDNLSKIPFIMGNKLANEFIFRYNLIKNQLIKDCKYDLINLINIFIEEIKKAKNYIYLENNKYLISPINLTHLNDLKVIQVEDSISGGIKWTKIKSINSDVINEEKKGIEGKINQELKKLNAKVKQFLNYSQLLELAGEYRHYGDLLMSSPNPKANSGNEIIVQDWSGEDLKISLDKKLNLIENAERYYKKAKKTEKDSELKKIELPKIQERLDRFNYIKSEFEKINSIKEIKNFKLNFAKDLMLKINQKMEQESKFRQFEIDGYQVFVGKSASNNDELTMKFARPNDIWLHARGVPGSHTLIKIHSKDKVSKEVIDKTASLAAYYSQSRKAGLVPVIYTEKKYVRKPKGANPGSVLVQKENVVMVKPQSPEELFG